MKKVLFSIFIILAFALFSCGEQTNNPPQDNHTTHTYSTTWSKNDSKHWKECSCGKRSEEASHSFGEWQEIEQATTSKEGLKEQICSICNYKKQEKINKLEPIYSWKSVDLLQPNVVIGGKSTMVLDENGNKVEFTKLVDRQLDMLSQEIISRLEYVYGDTNKKETHNIVDKLNNTTFTTYNSMNAFSESLSKSTRYPVYDNKGNSAGNGYIMMNNGEKVIYDNTLHSHYITLSGTKYAAVCDDNVAGVFTSETALQSTFEGLGKPTISHTPSSYDHEGILTFQNAIYGTPTWEYSEKTLGNSTDYTLDYNNTNLTNKWSWSEEFRNSAAVTKLKTYLAYIVANNITSYQALPTESVILSTNYDILLSSIPSITNYINQLQTQPTSTALLKDLIINRMIGTLAYANDQQAGLTADQIANAIYTTAQQVRAGESSWYYENGIYKQLYYLSITSNRINAINSNANTSLGVQDFLSARNYKGYDTIINGILRQVSNQTAYQDCNSLHYEQKSISSSIFTTLEETEIYLFFKSKTTNDVRIYLDVPYTTEVKLVDKHGNEVTFTKENVDGKLALKMNGSKLPNSSSFNGTILNDIQGYGASSSLNQLLKDLDYLELIISGVPSFALSTEEYVQIN